MLVSKENLKTFIPQQFPFVMVDALVSSDEVISMTIFTPSKDNVLVENGVFSAPGIIENIAQSAALGAGYEAKQNNSPIKIGYIGAIRNLEIFRLPHIGESLETEIVVENKVMDASIVKGYVRIGTELLASCEMRIFLKEPVNA